MRYEFFYKDSKLKVLIEGRISFSDPSDFSTAISLCEHESISKLTFFINDLTDPALYQIVQSFIKIDKNLSRERFILSYFLFEVQRISQGLSYRSKLPPTSLKFIDHMRLEKIIEEIESQCGYCPTEEELFNFFETSVKERGLTCCPDPYCPSIIELDKFIAMAKKQQSLATRFVVIAGVYQEVKNCEIKHSILPLLQTIYNFAGTQFSPEKKENPIEQKLVKSAADKDSLEDKDVNIALGVAAWMGQLDEVQRLVKHCQADINSTLNKRRETPLLKAAERGHLEVVKYLLDNKASIDLPDIHGDTALMAAISNGMFMVMECLLEHGVNINAQSREGNSALFWAIKAVHYKCYDVIQFLFVKESIKYLLSYGANPNLQNKDSDTVLHVLLKQYPKINYWDAHLNFSRDYLYGMQHLLGYGADINIRDRNGRTVLKLNEISKQLEVKKLEVQEKLVDQKDRFQVIKEYHSDIDHLLKITAKLRELARAGLVSLANPSFTQMIMNPSLAVDKCLNLMLQELIVITEEQFDQIDIFINDKDISLSIKASKSDEYWQSANEMLTVKRDNLRLRAEEKAALQLSSELRHSGARLAQLAREGDEVQDEFKERSLVGHGSMRVSQDADLPSLDRSSGREQKPELPDGQSSLRRALVLNSHGQSPEEIKMGRGYPEPENLSSSNCCSIFSGCFGSVRSPVGQHMEDLELSGDSDHPYSQLPGDSQNSPSSHDSNFCCFRK